MSGGSGTPHLTPAQPEHGVSGDGLPGLACVILAHADPEQVKRLIDALDPFPVFLHVDARTPDDVFKAMTTGLPARCMLIERVATGWATWGAVEAELRGYRAALDSTDATHIALLSGSDYPLASTSEIRKLLHDHPRDSFTGVFPLPFSQWGRSGGFSRLRYRHWAFGKRMLRLPIPRALPRDITFAGGPSNKVLSREHAEIVVRAADEHPELVRFWKRTWSSDETFVYSILSTPRFAPRFFEENVPENLWWIAWSEVRRKSPPWLGAESIDRLLARKVWSGQAMESVFARKFSTVESGAALDAIDGERRLGEDRYQNGRTG